jgi:hypothetical protein
MVTATSPTGQMNNVVTGPVAASSVSQVVITFADDGVHSFTFGGADPLGNTVGLKDGNFFLDTRSADITSNGIALDGAHSGVGGSTTTTGTGVYNGGGTYEVDEFYRLFGDSRGARTVNGLSNNDWNAAFGTSTGAAAYKWYFDYNLDGTINAADKGFFSPNLGKTLKA